MVETEYKHLLKFIQKYSDKYFKRGEMLIYTFSSLILSNPPRLHAQTYLVKGQRISTEISLTSDFELENSNQLEEITNDEAIKRLDELGFPEEAEKLRNPPNYIFDYRQFHQSAYKHLEKVEEEQRKREIKDMKKHPWVQYPIRSP